MSSYTETVRLLEGALLSAKVDTKEPGAHDAWLAWLHENPQRARQVNAIRVVARKHALGQLEAK